MHVDMSVRVHVCTCIFLKQALLCVYVCVFVNAFPVQALLSVLQALLCMCVCVCVCLCKCLQTLASWILSAARSRVSRVLLCGLPDLSRREESSFMVEVGLVRVPATIGRSPAPHSGPFLLPPDTVWFGEFLSLEQEQKLCAKGSSLGLSGPGLGLSLRLV